MTRSRVTDNDSFWWLLAAILGAAASSVSDWLAGGAEGRQGSSTAFLILLGCVLAGGLLLGFLRPSRPWRWGVGMLLLLPFGRAVSAQLMAPQSDDSLQAAISSLLMAVPFLVFPALPFAILGCYLGAFARKDLLQSGWRDYPAKWKQGEIRWWLLGAALGALGFFSRLALPGPDLLVAWLGLALAACVVGYARPTRAWRWGVASVLGAFVVVVVTGLRQAATAMFLLPVYALLALPAIGAAYLGVLLREGLPRRVELRQTKRDSGLWALSFLLGLLAGGIWVTTERLAVAAPAFFLAALVMGALERNRVWRWTIAVGLGLPICTMARVVVDGLRDAASHNLWPIELAFSLAFAMALSFGGVGVGTLVRSGLDRRAGDRRKN